MDRWACRDSYNWCSIGAKAKVRSYYNDQGPTLDTIAMRYAKDTYLDGPAWQAGYGGCMAALGDAYDSLYAH
jgi:hypothetical protein